MRSLFFDSRQKWRSGWRALGFFALTAACSTPLLIAHRFLPADVRFWLPGSWMAFGGALIATAVCLRLERRPIASVGLQPNPQFVRGLGAGIAVGLVIACVTAALVWLGGGLHFVRDPEASVGLILRSALVMLGVGLVEETVFHGYAFQRLVEGIGAWKAQWLIAVLFVLAHPVGELPPATALLAMLNTALAAVLFGLCLLRTGSLALPVGLHMGWNWSLEVLGLAVSGMESKGWWTPVQHAGREWLTGGSYGLEASPVDLVLLVTAIFVAWRWRRPTPGLATAA